MSCCRTVRICTVNLLRWLFTGSTQNFFLHRYSSTIISAGSVSQVGRLFILLLGKVKVLDIFHWKVRLSPDHFEHLMPLNRQAQQQQQKKVSLVEVFSLNKRKLCCCYAVVAKKTVSKNQEILWRWELFTIHRSLRFRKNATKNY